MRTKKKRGVQKRARKSVKKARKPRRAQGRKVHRTKSPRAGRTRRHYERQSKAPWPTEAADALLKKGRSRGFITTNELLRTFDNAEDYLDQVEEYLEQL